MIVKCVAKVHINGLVFKIAKPLEKQRTSKKSLVWGNNFRFCVVEKQILEVHERHSNIVLEGKKKDSKCCATKTPRAVLEVDVVRENNRSLLFNVMNLTGEESLSQRDPRMPKTGEKGSEKLARLPVVFPFFMHLYPAETFWN